MIMAKTTWALDPAHSEIQFKIKHMMISTITGEFTKFDASLETEDDDFTQSKATFTADVDSINSKNEQRDGHLKSPDFFDAPGNPQITFESQKLEKKDDEHYQLSGNLTIKGVSKPVVLQVAHSGVITDPYGNQRTGFEVSGKINRKDFGLTWHQLTEAGGLVVSDEVRLSANVEFVKQ
jgi:polyisoprenoid-binding protein YceI